MKKAFLNNLKTILILTPAITVILSASAFAQIPEIWGDLKPGPYAVGFKTIEKYDYSRVFNPKKDYFGNLIEGERARKIQICMWYPAEKDENAITMVYGEYAYPYPDNDEFIGLLSALQNREAGIITQIGGSFNFFLQVMDVPFAAVKDASPAAGQYPLIIFIPALGFSYSSNAVMCEYLASHGFIVATTHPVGLNEIQMQNSQVDLETLVRDAESVFGFVRDDDQINTDKLGVFGYGSGGAAALLFQMRNSDVEAIAGIGGSFTNETAIELIKENSYYSAFRAQVPLLNIYPDDSLLSKFTDSLQFAGRYSYQFKGTSRLDYSNAGLFSTMVPDSGGNISELRNPNHEIISRHIEQFFSAYLYDDSLSYEFINNMPEQNGFDPESMVYSFQPGGELPPTDNQFIDIIRQKGALEAVETYKKFDSLSPGSLSFDEAAFNRIGYQLIGGGRIEEAIAIMKLNAETFPNSANCWDSYADACIAAEDIETARMCYEKVLEVLPNDQNTDENLSETLRNNANNFLNPPQEENQ